jgi:hypothetical protein
MEKAFFSCGSNNPIGEKDRVAHEIERRICPEVEVKRCRHQNQNKYRQAFGDQLQIRRARESEMVAIVWRLRTSWLHIVLMLPGFPTGHFNLQSTLELLLDGGFLALCSSCNSGYMLGVREVSPGECGAPFDGISLHGTIGA